MLTSKQRAYLRSLANTQTAILQVGKIGINDNLINQVRDALNARELIKLSVLETSPVSAKEAANELAEMINCDVVQVIGSKFVLYKESKDKKKIQL
ncbi:MAG: ribosome assembly RNA-binding protein YhbY [Ruminococcaceae bacterium]|nr:ribosome assembly RNA-binding protein YhbY [Oscillospiraceae bacterium]